MKTHRLKLKSLKFISSVDVPAQETATARLLKGANGPIEVSGTARAVKISDELGLVFGWALTTKSDGADYFDLQGDNIVEDDLIKVAAAFMEAGGAADTMHDREQDGRVVFAMPLTAEVAKAFGIDTETHGLMVAIKPSPEDFAKFKSRELTGFSIDGMGERTPFEKSTNGKTVNLPVYAFAKQVGAAIKAQLYTDEVDGHQHQISVCDDGSMWCSYAVATGAGNSHNHGIVFETGTVMILADSGHTHEIAAGQPGVAIVPADAIVVVQARAPLSKNQALGEGAARKSTHAAAAHKVASHQELSPMPNEIEKQVADLTKQNERLGRVAKMSGAHKTHFDALAGDDADVFLAKSNAERESEVKAAAEADKPIWTGETTKVAVRARDGELALTLAKQNEAHFVALNKREAEIEKTEVRSIAKAHLGALAGDDDTHDYIVRSIRKGGGDQAMVDKALTAMKGWNSLGATASKAKGAGGNGAAVEGTALEAFNAELETFAKTVSKTPVAATSDFLKTVKGQELYAATRASN